MAAEKVFVVIIMSCVVSGFALQSCLPIRISLADEDLARRGTCQKTDTRDTQRSLVQAQIRGILDRIKPFIDREHVSAAFCNGNGWKRVAFLNMSDPTETCPVNLTLHTSPDRGCGQKLHENFSCDSLLLKTCVESYSRVCGRILAYQKGSPNAFWNYISFNQTTIDSAYVEGVSLTHGPDGSRQHIWTFAAALLESLGGYRDVGTPWNCACSSNQYSWPHQLPSFVGSNYFCDTGNPSQTWDHVSYYPNDPLWDGEGCGTNSTCCEFNNPPWFQTTLPQTTGDDIELRLCHGNEDGEDTIINLIEIYVK